MKKVIIAALLILSVVAVEAADKKEVKSTAKKETKVEQKAQKQIVTTIFNVDVDCEGCIREIMAVIPYQKGVKSVEVDLKRKEVEVSYDASKNTDAKLIAAFAKIHKRASVKQHR